MSGNKSKSASRAWDSVEPALSPWILEAVSALGFAKMTPVQASTLPLFMGNKDVVVEAVTGSGKTLSFLIPVVEKVLRVGAPTKKHHVSSIVVAPTRELAIQIEKVLLSLIAFHTPSAALRRVREAENSTNDDDLKSADENEDYSLHPKIVSQLLVSGTTSPTQDLQTFLEYSPNVLVGTPGRLIELLSSSRVRCTQSSFEVLVLDEADRLLDLGFKDDLQKIIGLLPKQRRTGLFSASVSEALDQLIRVGIRNPVHIAVKVKGTSGKAEQRTPSSLQMSYIIARASQKLPALFKVLSHLQPTPQKSIIYLSTCAAVDYFQHVLTPLLAHHTTGYTLISLHGKHTPQVRTKNFTRFSESISPTILLTTDVAARGLDIPQVDLVMQVDPPLDPKVFLHRCGRAGRAGRRGIAILFLHPGREEDYVEFLDVRKTPITAFNSVDSTVSPQESEELTKKIREVVLKDRAIHDKAQRGFVSAVQAYRKHQTKSIFRVQDLDWGELAEGWGLLKLPRMPESKGWDGDPGLGLGVDFETYGYADKKREQARIRKDDGSNEVAKDATQTNAQAQKRAWSGTLDQKDGREKRREKKKAKRERLKSDSMTAEEKEKKVDLERLIELAKRQRTTEEVEFEGFKD